MDSFSSVSGGDQMNFELVGVLMCIMLSEPNMEKPIAKKAIHPIHREGVKTHIEAWTWRTTIGKNWSGYAVS